MVVREGAGDLVYRNSLGEVWSQSLVDDRPLFVTQAPGPLTTFGDEFFLMAEAGRWIFHGTWTDLGGSRQPLFSNGVSVYAASRSGYGWNLSSINDGVERTICPGLIPPTFELAAGHQYPFAYFHEVGRQLSVYSVNLAECWTSETRFQNPIEGDVRQVLVVPGKGTAVSIHHPKRNLLWGNAAGCRFYDLGEEPVRLPNPALPYLVTGNDLVNLESGTVAKILGREAKDVAITSDEKTVYLAGPTIRRIRLR
jgi:hypothetical protein